MQARLYGDIVNISKPPLTSNVSRGSLKKPPRDGDKKNIRDRLKKLMTRRPTIEELQKKGILKGSKKLILKTSYAFIIYNTDTVLRKSHTESGNIITCSKTSYLFFCVIYLAFKTCPINNIFQGP
mgnify:CR=1 FL=1